MIMAILLLTSIVTYTLLLHQERLSTLVTVLPPMFICVDRVGSDRTDCGQSAHERQV